VLIDSAGTDNLAHAVAVGTSDDLRPVFAYVHLPGEVPINAPRVGE
jgi:hypothetical protein